MSAITLNLVCEPGPGGKFKGNSKQRKYKGNARHDRFLGRRNYMEHKGLLKEKQNKKQSRKKKQNKSKNAQLNRGDRSTPDAIFPKFTSCLPNKTNELPSSAKTSTQQSTISFPSTASTSKRDPTHQAAPRTLGPLKYVALDCEMVGTGPKGCNSELARCSIVSYDGDVIFDKFIKPLNHVTDFRTRYSGIRRQDLFNATPFYQAQREILKILTGKMVVGHAIHNDFKALKYFHPACQTRDTARIPLLNQKAGFPEDQTVSLKRLTKAIFNRDIQTGKRGHSSVEDAKATMELYKVVENTWEQKLTALSLTAKAMDLALNQK
ncbi:interferon-stimulated 20 kDa exonuclease-like 2 [Pimephales promelas]|uniref:interferon-stimulated 20 kDa exonuclease-like 2 n=1 Tax=Pimephales promelas TaxID=90988 RepID=UPI001955A9F4|nr:interferon-stimulated 20 kDa exonuclease-like 2 [Pimephales promelas]KAG1947951.1 interferon-stimulated 20 kDa exonuclease-like [Pimephales promelas]